MGADEDESRVVGDGEGVDVTEWKVVTVSSDVDGRSLLDSVVIS